MTQFRLTIRAQRDLAEIWDAIGIQHDNPTAADRLIDKVYDQMSMLASQPRLGQMRDEWSPNLRIFPIGNYAILYFPQEEGIEVIGVVYGRRDLPSLFMRGRRRFDS